MLKSLSDACFKAFQFHKGTIKLRYSACVCSDLDCFNSIKVRLNYLRALILHAKQSFNSIKVRLNSNVLARTPSSLVCFNSIKVRLNPGAPVASVLPFQFQFHKGTIKPIRTKT